LAFGRSVPVTGDTEEIALTVVGLTTPDAAGVVCVGDAASWFATDVGVMGMVDVGATFTLLEALSTEAEMRVGAGGTGVTDEDASKLVEVVVIDDC
jgi:hypothetical protein